MNDMYSSTDQVKVKQVLPISVIIPTMNRPETLRRTLRSYMSSEYLPLEIIVVDQSIDSAVAEQNRKILHQCLDVETHYIYQKAPSLTIARNRGLKEASQEVVIFSDDDIDVYTDTIANLNSIMSDEKIALIAGIDDNITRNSKWIGFLLGTRSFSKRKIGHVTKAMLGRYPDKVLGQIETEWAMGYFFAIRKSLAEKWNIYWDENLTSYAYAEDLDFSYRYCKKAKYEHKKSVLDEKVRVRHIVSEEYRVPSAKNTSMYVMNRFYLASKHNMGVTAYFCMLWCDSWKIVEKIIKNEKPLDLLKAVFTTIKYRKEISIGRFKY